jgi:hypothetical protein
MFRTMLSFELGFQKPSIGMRVSACMNDCASLVSIHVADADLASSSREPGNPLLFSPRSLDG